MKRILFILWVASALPAWAQVESGNKFINGTVNLSIISNDGDAQTAFTINPTFGYFINDQLAVGGSLGLVSQFSDDSDFTVFLSPFARWYFPIVDDRFYFYANGEIAFSYGNSAANFEEFRSSDDAFSVGISASPGFVFFPSERWGLEFTLTALGINIFNIGGEGDATTLFILGATTFSPRFGLSYYF